MPMFTTDLVNLYNRNIFETSLYIYIFQDEKCRLMPNLSLSMIFIIEVHVVKTEYFPCNYTFFVLNITNSILTPLLKSYREDPKCFEIFQM